jgi:hypothetical protein
VNGAWVPLDSAPKGPNLTDLPAILPLRVTLTGTTDLMPGFGLGNSQIIVRRPKTTFTWIGKTATLGSPTTSIKIITDLQAYEEAKHDCTVTLKTCATLATTETADLVQYETLPNGTIRRTSVFNITATSKYEVRIVGSTTTAADLFLVSELIEFAQS